MFMQRKDAFVVILSKKAIVATYNSSLGNYFRSVFLCKTFKLTFSDLKTLVTVYNSSSYFIGLKYSHLHRNEIQS